MQDPADRSVQFVVEQNGTIRAVRNGARLPGAFLDLTRAVAAGGERGLLGLAFAPDPASGRFFVNFTNPAGDTVVARYRRLADPLIADADSRFDLRWNGTGGRHSSRSRSRTTTAGTSRSVPTVFSTSAWATAVPATIPRIVRRIRPSCSERCCEST